LVLPEPARTAAWYRWRSHLDLDSLSYASLQTLPALTAALPQWLDEDSLAPRIQGILKMAWSRNQVLLHAAAELHATLLQSSISPAPIIGPLAWSLLAREDGAIRTIPDLTLLIPRKLLFQAVSTLILHGWQLQSPQPGTDTLHWSSNLALSKSGKTLHLHWRITPHPHPEAPKFEFEILKNLRTIPWRGHHFQVLSPEADLLHRLIDRPYWDPVPWQADVLMSSFDNLNWPRFKKLAQQFPSSFQPIDPLQRLADLRREWNLPIPPILAFNRLQPQIRAKLSRWGSLLWKA
jgi:hypothetical protein